MIDRALYKSVPFCSKRITLCGSTKFLDQFDFWNTHLTLAGNVVYSVAVDAHSHSADDLPTDEEKDLLDKVHMGKITNSDAIFVIDVNKYIGKSTTREIEFAKQNKKDIYFLSKIFPKYVKLEAYNRSSNS